MVQARFLAISIARAMGHSRRPRKSSPRFSWFAAGRMGLPYACLGFILSLLYVAGWSDGLAGNAIYDLTGLSAVVAIFVGVAVYRPRRPLAWRLLALGQLLFVVGDVIWAGYEVVLQVTVPYPSWGDVFYLAGYPVVTASVLLFTRQRTSSRDRSRLIDAAIVATSAGIFAWLFLMEPYATDASLSLLERLISIAYPLGDLAVLAVAARLILLVGRSGASYLMLLLSFLLMLVSDAQYGYQVLAGTYSTGTLTVDGFLLFSYVLTGCAALLPSMTRLTERIQEKDMRGPRLRLLILAVALLLMPAALGAQIALGQRPNVPVVLGGSFIIALLVLSRMTGLLDQLQRRYVQLKEQEGALRAALAQREALSEQLRHQALHDPLTRLPNRVLLADRLDLALARRKRTGAPLSMLFLDLDNFKSVNDSFGHAAGDALLFTVGERLIKCVRPEDTVARIGGDEFAILLEGAEARQASIVADRILEDLRLPFQTLDKLVAVHSSIGIAVSESDGESGDDLLRKADLAMYEAKRRGKDRYVFFEPRLQSDILERQHARADLKRAIEQKELVVHYQPLIELKSNRIVAVEGLVRWVHPQKGVIPPGQFIAAAEESGLIYDIDRYVLREGMRQIAVWRQQIDPDLQVGLNVSAVTWQRPALARTVEELLQEFGLPGGALTLEITETALLNDSEALIEILIGLRSVGVSIALDDFGTGFSSLTHLRKLPIDVLKIDKSFVADITGSARSAALAQVVHSLGQKLGLVTVAEGVEEHEQLEVLISAGCDLAQGYLFARPQPAAQMEDLLGTGLAPARNLAKAVPA